MNIKSFIIVGLAIIVLSNISMANPFAAKINKKTPPTKKQAVTKTKVKVTYHGYAFVNDEVYAVIQFKGKQFIVREGERKKNIHIKKITEEQIRYSYRGKTYQAKLLATSKSRGY